MNNYQIMEAEIIRQPAPYSGIILESVTYKQYPGMTFIRFFADNLYGFSDSQMNSIAEWMKKLLDDLNAIPGGNNYTYEVVDSA